MGETKGLKVVVSWANKYCAFAVAEEDARRADFLERVFKHVAYVIAKQQQGEEAQAAVKAAEDIIKAN